MEWNLVDCGVLDGRNCLQFPALEPRGPSKLTLTDESTVD